VVQRVVSELGALDVLVNNAGGANPAPFVETAPAQLEEALRFRGVPASYGEALMRQ
jgi:NAD(P)-dependent dehydrogenase (short-subunit alcohol dehydrogenase family)